MIEDQYIDRRIIRTKAVIRDAFISLIEEKGFDALTVKDITTRANINRGTFYLHYRDKYDLLEQTEAEIIQNVQEIFSHASSLKPTDFKNTQEPLPVLVRLFEYLFDNASLMHAMLGLQGVVAFQTQIKKALERNFLKREFFIHIKEEDFLVPGEYLISYILSAHLGVVQVWLQKGCRESPKEMALILSKITFNGPLYAAGIDPVLSYERGLG